MIPLSSVRNYSSNEYVSLARKHICFARENVVLANRKRLSTLFSEAKIKERMSSLFWFGTNVKIITNARSVNSL
jgi:hypothetical protein